MVSKLSDLKEFECAKITGIIDICSQQCINQCHEGKKGFLKRLFNAIYYKLHRNKCAPKKNLSETFPFVSTNTVQERIFSLGIIPGVKVQMIGKTPLKDPIVVDLSGHLISLRKAEADLICIERELV